MFVFRFLPHTFPQILMNFERPDPVLLKDFVDLGEATAPGSPKKRPCCGRALLLCVGEPRARWVNGCGSSFGSF